MTDTTPQNPFRVIHTYPTYVLLSWVTVSVGRSVFPSGTFASRHERSETYIENDYWSVASDRTVMWYLLR